MIPTVAMIHWVINVLKGTGDIVLFAINSQQIVDVFGFASLVEHVGRTIYLKSAVYAKPMRGQDMSAQRREKEKRVDPVTTDMLRGHLENRLPRNQIL